MSNTSVFPQLFFLPFLCSSECPLRVPLLSFTIEESPLVSGETVSGETALFINFIHLALLQSDESVMGCYSDSFLPFCRICTFLMAT